MKEIAIYVEGGGDTAQQKAELRTGLDALLQQQKNAARAKRLGGKLPARPNLEEEPKSDLYARLKNATRDTKKGEYAKIKHAVKILALVDVAKVAQRCPRFGTFTNWLTAVIGNA